MLCVFFFFFFSSRRRHTRSLRDWSSDVCSSDLALAVVAHLIEASREVVSGTGFRGHDIYRAVLARIMEPDRGGRSEEHTSELQSRRDLVCRLLLEKKKEKERESGGEVMELGVDA